MILTSECQCQYNLWKQVLTDASDMISSDQNINFGILL